MSVSLLALTDFEALVLAQLLDPTHATFTIATVDEALQLALREYSAASVLPGARIAPNQIAGTFTPANGVRETNIYAQTFMREYIDVAEVWFPYVDASSIPQPVRFRLIKHTGQALLRFEDVVGDGVTLARVFARVEHTIKDLGAEAATSVALGDEDALARGAAGFAIQARAAKISEDTSLTIWSVPNYRKLAEDCLVDFRAYIAPAKRARSIPFKQPGRRIYRPGTLS